MAKLSSKQRRLVSEAVRSFATNLGLSPQRQIQQNQDGKGQNEQRPADAPNDEAKSALWAWVASVTWIAILVSWWSHSLGGVFNYFGGNPNILYPFAVLSCIAGLVGANVLRLYFKWPWVFNSLAVVAFLPVLLLAHRFVVHEKQRLRSEAAERYAEHSIITNEPSRFDRVDLGISNVSRKIDTLDERNRPRHLTDQQFVRLVQTFQGIPKEVIELKAVDADVEASKFREELSAAFTQAGFTNSFARVMGVSVDTYPAVVTLVDNTFPSPDPIVADRIYAGLNSAGVFVTPFTNHPDAMGNRLFVLVGPKPDDNAAEYEVITTRPDYIKGTQTTHERLSQFFPFGYTVIFYGEKKRFKYEVSNNGLLDWTLDLEKLKIEPDFTNGKVKWTLTVSAATEGTSEGPHTVFFDTQLTTTSPLKAGDVRRVAVYWANKPVPHVAVLGVDQKNPVFAVGFRIPLASERPKQQEAVH